ncbi:MAG: helix-turn-helix transcriptional regulator [Vicinamibacterales bacterium]|jgi:DNA-binding transcriptional ArsR family regulator|nr:transcriptional regulator [Acidobacteriota bacterium]MDP6371029.1 helix-turn-helix transcriptional regulator [Vicinamibacterales bacterium]MDP6609844.1 helix-turn-helix transcriptional regulator [Vicinamibacterales bacterium]HAK57107.1 transcriptional regulator [Acidobacteriota bacterium]|tara:strand:+ start:6969 stop:7298 length:330 start_codon:yes stop_codon:yes gene_type:complete
MVAYSPGVPDVFAAVADPTRRRLLERLRTGGALSVTELSAPLPISRQAVTKHLGLLERAGLIEHEWAGRERLHRLRPKPLQRVDTWLAPYARAWDRRLARLARHLDEHP